MPAATDALRQHLYLPLKHVVRKLYYRRAVRRLVFLPEEIFRSVIGGRDPMVPPKWMIFTGPGDFMEVGRGLLRILVDVGGLKPDEHLLDVGCGVGRMAIVLTGYLGPQGSYEGFDVVREGIEWCQANITPRFPRFRFTVADVYNGVYRPDAPSTARDYRFPYPDASFDFVFLMSVFTHMLPPDVENYVREISRVLRPGGRCLITYFLVNEAVRSLIASGKSTLPMRDQPGGYSTIDRGTPEYDIGLPESFVLSLYEKAGLQVVAPIHYGTWSGRPSGLNYQDFVLARKTG